MNDRTLHATESFLEHVITRTSEHLRKEFAHLVDLAVAEAGTLEKIAKTLGLTIEDTTADQSVVDDVTWHPVAEICVVTILRNLLIRAQKDRLRLTLVEFADLNQTLGTPEFAARVGLSLEDARLALGLTARVLGHDLSRSLALEMDGSEFVFYGEQGSIIVENAKPTKRVTAEPPRLIRLPGVQTGNRVGS